MLRSRGLSRLMNPRRITPTLGTAVGAACAAALIGLAPAATADTEPDPFEDLLGSYGSNSWTVSADNSLATSDPTLAASFDTSVDNFGDAGIPPAFENILGQLDPSAFSVELTGPDQYGYFPVTDAGDLAVGLDYTLFASGLGSTVEPALWNTFEWGEAILLSPLLLLAGFFA
jgi:hypothetical protein